VFRINEEWWLVVPLLQGRNLFGFIVLKKPKVVPPLNFEDHDLLRTVGRQVGTHINQAETDRRLLESSQFGTYDRLSAFLMHDLNNLVAQQSLVVKNAEKFRHNPQFVDDAISTIANSVARMKRLMEQLTSGSKVRKDQNVNLQKVLRDAVQRSAPRMPEPKLTAEQRIIVRADPERLCTVVEHLIRNAQDATDKSGRIDIDVSLGHDGARVSIRDSGCGMTMEFMRERLFRPFDSTKGSQSMGIGAYQAREYIRSLGGQVTVTSEPGHGTTFNLTLPAITESES
jgi:putative PEP-CTERM system histidine kinase